MTETPELERILRELRREYLADAPARIAELRKDAAALRTGEADALDSLKLRSHRLAGSAGSYGFPQLSVRARALEELVGGIAAPTGSGTQSPPVAHALADQITSAVEAIALEFDREATEAGPVGPAPRFAEPSGNALLVADDGATQQELSDALRDAGYSVRTDFVPDPAKLTVSKRPDLVVLAPDRRVRDPYAYAAIWSALSVARPHAVVLIASDPANDPVRAVAAGVDLVLPLDNATAELARHARILARIHHPPPRVLLALSDVKERTRLTAELEPVGVTCVATGSARALREVLTHEMPDIVLVGDDLPDADAIAVARLLRQDPRISLLTLVVLSPTGSTSSPVAALRAGADDWLATPADAALLLELVRSRVARTRRLAAMVFRDQLTGSLNHAALVAEFDSAVAHAHRTNAGVAFLAFGFDHFARVNERYGHLTGDRMLAHMADLLKSGVRASDAVGRLGGDEFGVLLRNCTPEGAVIVAHKLHQILGQRPLSTARGDQVPVLASVGGAVFRQHGDSAAELVHAAHEAVLVAKAGGRGRVVFAGVVTRAEG